MGYEMLELYEAKVSCTVLRGERRSNPPDLPDMQSLYALALEPIAETMSDLRSFGFRRHRSTKDALSKSFYP
jgi:RNA-directed DNA polymerase